mgnify:CR=1 FL=1
MGLIINKKIQELMIGYPTISDKYDVAPAVLEGTTSVKFGEPVKFGSTKGYFEAIGTNVPSAASVAGFALATNVKLNTIYPEGGIEILPGEAFNLLIRGAMAVELDSAATLASATANSAVHIILATGKLTTVDKYEADKVVPLTGVVFTGLTETQGEKKVAEIFVK